MKDKLLYNGQSTADVIRKRTSVRTYKDQAIAADLKNKLAVYFNTIKGPFDVKSRFLLVENNMKDSTAKLGTYGVIKNPPAFILAAVEKKDMYLEQLGYEFEKAVLYATSLGLGTCWLGGSFKKAEFAKAAHLKENEELPIVSPVGYPADSKTLLEKVMRLGAGSNNRKEWGELFFNKSFDKKIGREEADKYGEALEMVRLGPSASNKQPWRIVMEDKRFHFFLQHAKGYSKALGFDIQRVDIGIAMCHFEQVLEDMGLKGVWIVKHPGISNLPEGAEYIVSWEKRS